MGGYPLSDKELEAIDQLKSKPEGFTHGPPWNSIRYRLIKAYQAKNHDGTSSGWEKGTPDGDRECIECKVVMDGVITKYKNYWNIREGILKFIEEGF